MRKSLSFLVVLLASTFLTGLVSRPTLASSCGISGGILIKTPGDEFTCPGGETAWFTEHHDVYCVDGSPGGPWNDNRVDFPPECGTPPILVAALCEWSCRPPKCEGDANDDKCKFAGDPFDVTSGYLYLNPTDVDLGHGLKFQRFYSSAPGEIQSLGYNWSHNWEWRAQRITKTDVDILLVREPQSLPRSFVEHAFAPEDGFQSGEHDGSVEDIDGTAFRYTAGDGTVVEFAYWYTEGSNTKWLRPSSIKLVGEPAIQVTYDDVAEVETYDNGLATLAIHHYTSGWADGFVSQVVAGGETYAYTYTTTSSLNRKRLSTVTVPDLSTSNPTDTVVFTHGYYYTQLTLLLRDEGGVRTTDAAWTYENNWSGRLVSADEPALDQKLTLEYPYSPGNPITRIKNEAGQTLAEIESEDGAIVAVTGSGGPGFEVPYASATLESIHARTFWRTIEDGNGNVTLHEGHDLEGQPARIVEGWVDHDADDAFSAGDGYARLTEYTYHPSLDTPLTITTESTLTGLLEAVTTFDYDDPGDPNDDPQVANEKPTSLLYREIRAGKTLDATGSVVPIETIVSYTYDSEDRVTSISGPRAANHTEFTYDPVTGYRTAVRRYLNGPASSYLETIFSNFDARGNPQTITDPNGEATSYTYDAESRIISVRPPYGGVGDPTISFTYDFDGNLIRVDFPADSFSNSYFLTIGYDTKHNPTYIADANGEAIVYAYEASRRTRESRYTGFVDLQTPGTLVGDAKFAYDTAGRLFRAFNPLFGDDSVYTEFGYDAKGNPIDIDDENGRHDDLLYDALDRLVSLQQQRSVTYTTGLAYDALSNVSQLTDAASAATDYVTDDLGRLVKVVSPDTGTTLFLYDAAGNRTQQIEAVGVTDRSTQYTYDGLDRLLTIDYPTDADWAYTYDTDALKHQKGRLASVSNGTVTTELEYTPRGLIAVERTSVVGGSYALTYTYDAAGNVATIASPSGVTTEFRYAGARPKEIAVTAASQTETIREIGWQPFGPRTHAEFPPYDSGTSQNVVTSDRQYNLRGQVEEIDVVAPQGVVLDRNYTYDYTAGAPGPVDAGSNLDRVIDHRDGTQSRFYFYDELARLEAAKQLAGTVDESFAYDAAGNRTSWVDASGTTTYTYEVGTNRLRQATGTHARSYAHDAYGNRIYQGATAYTGTASLIFNEQNRLVEAKDADNAFVTLGTYTYDAFGRRVRKVAGGETTIFLYDQTGQLLAEYVLGATTDETRDYVYAEDELVGFVDQEVTLSASLWQEPAVGWLAAGSGATVLLLAIPALRRRPAVAAGLVGLALVAGGVGVANSQAGGAEFFWVHTDHLGTPLAVTNTPGMPGLADTVWRAVLAPYGEATVDEDPDGDLDDLTVRIRFPGQYFDAETGLHYNRYRYFSPELGRYISGDPIGQIAGADANLYAYVGSNPNRAVDPLGLSSGFISRAAQNFVTTNQVVPGVVAPPLASGLSGISGKVAAGRGVKTALGLGFKALVNPSSITAAAVIRTAKATAIAWAAAAVAWEAGVAVGSLVAAIPVPGGPDATVGTFYGDLLFNHLNPPAPCGGAGTPAPGAGGTGAPAPAIGGGT